MSLLDRLAEAHIRDAAQRGVLDDLPGEGQPLPPDDAGHVPPELRAGYRLLKNAGYVPPEVNQAREINELRDLLSAVDNDSHEADRAMRRLRLLETTLAANRHGRGLLRDARYDSRLRASLARRQEETPSGGAARRKGTL